MNKLDALQEKLMVVKSEVNTKNLCRKVDDYNIQFFIIRGHIQGKDSRQ